MPMSRRRHSFYVAGIVVSMFFGAQAHAELGTIVALGYSDNLGRIENGEESEPLIVAGFGGHSQTASSALEGEVSWEIGAVEYLNDGADDEPLIFLDGSAEFQLIDRRFSWLLTNRVNRLSTDPFVPATPESREYMNYFVTGPTFMAPLGSDLAVDLGITYTDIWYEERALDNSGTGARVGLQFNLAARQSLGVYAAAQEVEYDESAVYQDYRRHQAFFQYVTDRPRGDIRFALGRSEIRRSGEPDRDSPMVELSWARTVSAFGSVSVELRHGLFSANNLFDLRGTAAVDLESIEYLAEFGEPYELGDVSVRYGFAKPRTSVELGLSWQEQTYDEGSALDRELASWELTLARNLNRRISMNVSYFSVSQEFVLGGQQDDDRRAGVGLAWRLGRNSEVGIQAVHYERSSSIPGSVYRENRVFLSFSYGAALSGLQTSF